MEDKLTIVDAAARVEGKLTGRDARILGRFEGEIQLTGRLQIGEGAEVNGRVKADACEIGGRYRGQLEARSVLLLEKARVEGSLDAVRLEGNIWPQVFQRAVAALVTERPRRVKASSLIGLAQHDAIKRRAVSPYLRLFEELAITREMPKCLI